MSRIKTYTASLLFAALLTPAGSSAQSISHTFASCTGRLSAELEHAWLMGDQNHAQVAEQRRAFIDLLEAVTPADARRDALAIRIDAKMAHASILTRATFVEDADESAWAFSQAQMHLRACTDLLLGS